MPSPYSFTVRSDGQTISAAHVNGLQTGIEELGAGTFNIIHYGAVVDGATNDSAAVVAANAAATALANGAVVVFPTGVTRLSANVTIDPDVSVLFQPGAQVLIDSGITLTLGGALLAPPDRQLFTGSGTVALTAAIAIRGVQAAWWGVVADAKYVNDPTAPGGGLVITSATAAFTAADVGKRYTLLNPALINTTLNNAEKTITGVVQSQTATTITVTITDGTAAGGGTTLTAIPAMTSGADTTHTYNDGSTYIRRRALTVGTDCSTFFQKAADAVTNAMAAAPVAAQMAGRYGILILPPGGIVLGSSGTGVNDTDPGSDQGTATNQGYAVRFFKGNIWVRGAGVGVTTIYSIMQSVNGLYAHNSTTNPCTNIRISDMTLRSVSSFNDCLKMLRLRKLHMHDMEALGGDYPLQIMGCSNTLLERIKAGQILYAGGAAFSIVDQNSPTGDTPQGTADVTVRDCEAFETAHGFRLSGDDATVGSLTFASRPIRVTVDNCHVHHGATYDSNGTGFVLTKVWGVRLRGCSARSMNYGIVMDQCEGVRVTDPLIVTNEQTGIYLLGSTRCSVLGGEVFNNGTAGTQTIGVWTQDNGPAGTDNSFIGIHHGNDTAYGVTTMARQATGFYNPGAAGNLFMGCIRAGDNPAGGGYTDFSVNGGDTQANNL